jgi:hypothetical protein
MEDPGICQIFFFWTNKYGELDTDSVIHQGNASRSQKGKKQILNKQHDLLHRFLLFVRSKARLPVQTRAVSDVSEYSIMNNATKIPGQLKAKQFHSPGMGFERPLSMYTR